MSQTSEAPNSPPSIAPESGAARRHPVRTAVQIAGFGACVVLLVWCVRVALRPENRANLERLREASAGQIAGLLGFSLCTVLISGAVFRQSLTPVRKLGMTDVQATNAIACLMALLPFKLSIFFRVLVHNRRDGVPLLTIAAWFLCVSAIIVCVLVPVIAVSMVRHKVDAVWAAASLAGIAVCTGALVLIARAITSERAWSWVVSIWERLPMPGALRRSGLLDRAREGVRILSSPGAVAACAALRTLDIGVQAGRVVIAAGILGQAMPVDQAVLAGCAYFLIGAVAPTSQVGAREAGTAWLLHFLFPALDLDRTITVVLSISAAEVITLLVCAAVGAVYLRPDKLLRPRGG